MRGSLTGTVFGFAGFAFFAVGLGAGLCGLIAVVGDGGDVGGVDVD